MSEQKQHHEMIVIRGYYADELAKNVSEHLKGGDWIVQNIFQQQTGFTEYVYFAFLVRVK